MLVIETESEKMLNKISALEANIINNKLSIESDEFKSMHQLTDDFNEKTKPIFIAKRNN